EHVAATSLLVLDLQTVLVPAGPLGHEGNRQVTTGVTGLVDGLERQRELAVTGAAAIALPPARSDEHQRRGRPVHVNFDAHRTTGHPHRRLEAQIRYLWPVG